MAFHILHFGSHDIGERMKKVGIITMYYGSKNYGGALQAYALQKAVSQMGYECEQIAFKREGKKDFKSRVRNRLEVNSIFEVLKWMIERVYSLYTSKLAKKIYAPQYKDKIQLRNNKFERFCEAIPHSKTYTTDTIKESRSKYDVFICGSDQIWKPGVACKEYLLEFVPNEKVKFSYAASISRNCLSQAEQAQIINGVNQLDSISVREKQAVSLLNAHTDRMIEWVLDPTMLLTRQEWEEQCAPRLVEGKYIFCYLLGADNKQRKVIKQLASTKHMKIVTIPYASGKYNFVDHNFGDIHICEAGPNDFLSLIKYAALIITDSFHATVFSNIFKRDFYVLERSEEATMNSRIISLLDILEQEDRFVEKDVRKILEDKSIQYKTSKKYEEMLIRSKNYLEKSIDKRIS